jgi:hypothetical protein
MRLLAALTGILHHYLDSNINTYVSQTHKKGVPERLSSLFKVTQPNHSKNSECDRLPVMLASGPCKLLSNSLSSAKIPSPSFPQKLRRLQIHMKQHENISRIHFHFHF